MAQVLTYSIPASILALYLQADEGGGIPWWVWVILIIVLLLLLLIAFSRQSEPGEPLPKPEERMAPPAAAPVVEPVAEVVESVDELVSEEVAEEPVKAPAAPDDLKRIEGIGPKISSILNAGGITTFSALAATDSSRLQELLDEADIRLAVPDTWPEQASLAAAGKWEELGALQDSLKGGRKA